jgi:hypothetical protein
MNRHERRAAKALGHQLNISDELWDEVVDLPLFQVTIARDGAPDVTLVLSPQRWCDLQAAFAFEFANGLQIESQVRELAEHLRIPFTPEFRNLVFEVLGGTIMLVVRGRSSKELARVFEEVAADPGKAIERMGDNKLYDLVIRTLSEQVLIDPSDPIAKLSGPEQLRRAAKNAQAGFGEPPPGRGRPREDDKLNFFEGVVAIARIFGADVGLPQHGREDDAAVTPLFLFGEAMLDLLVCHGTAFAIESGVGGDRFATFARLNRAGLLAALERARKTVLAERLVRSTTPQK